MSSSYVPPIIGPSGLTVPTYQQILDFLTTNFKAIYGQNVYLGNDSADFQMLSIFALLMNDNMQALVLDYNNRAPSTAIGGALDLIAKISGLARKTASFSTATVTLIGTPNTVIIEGIVSDVNGNNWDLPTSVMIGGGGSVSVTATCEVSGPIVATAGQINGIVTPTAGWTGVTNASAATVGQPVETDSQLRTRYAISTSLPSITMLDGTIAAIAATEGVTRYNVLENPTGATDANGNPPHSVTAVVEGGADLDVATAIYNNKGIGCFTNGGNSVTVVDAVSGVTMVISFDRPTYQPIYVTLNVHALAGYTSSTTLAIRNAVTAYLNSLQIGEILTISGLYGAALSVMPNLSNPLFSIRGLFAGLSPGPSLSNDIVMTFSQVTQGVLANVVVNSV